MINKKIGDKSRHGEQRPNTMKRTSHMEIRDRNAQLISTADPFEAFSQQLECVPVFWEMF
jgi:hypothetical protein